MAHIRDEMRTWVRSATILIPFKPDREAVSKELLEHIEDKTLDIQRIYPDMTEREAMERALGQMGDPYEIGRELAKIHKPWLGYLWRASQVMLAIAAALAVVGVFWQGPDSVVSRLETVSEGWQGFYQDQDEIFGDELPADTQRLALYCHDAETQLGNCTIAVSQAALCQKQGENPALYVELCLEYDYPWEVSETPFYHFWFEDSLGNQYHNNQWRWPSADATGFTRQYRCLVLSDFPETAQWLRLHYLDGSGLDLKLDLTKEVRG